ncbi:MAG: hypothetical protein ABIM89_06275 [Mycobacteriales bacterium]
MPPGGLYEFGEYAANALRVHEGDGRSHAAVAGLFVHQLQSSTDQLGDRVADVVDAVPDVVHALAVSGEKARNWRVISGRLQ